MDTFDVVRYNLLSPMVLAFALGIVASLLKSDLRLPEAVYKGISMYLLFAIGLKGGFGFAETPLDNFWGAALVTFAIGIGVPIWSYAILRKLGRFDIANSAAIAAHYGSVSAVTFSAALAFLAEIGQPAEGFMPTLVVVLEIPAIVVALLIAQVKLGNSSWKHAMREVVFGSSIFLLIGGALIGALSGDIGQRQISPFFTDLFAGVLTLFLLEMGVITGKYLHDIKHVGGFLVAFGIAMPLLHGFLGVWLGGLVGLSLGGKMVLGVLSASASYIAAPAAVRIALPQANPSYYLTAAIGITFPFNLIVGLPLYYQLAVWLS